MQIRNYHTWNVRYTNKLMTKILANDQNMGYGKHY